MGPVVAEGQKNQTQEGDDLSIAIALITLSVRGLSWGLWFIP